MIIQSFLKGCGVLSDKSYSISLIVLSCFASVVLILGTVLCLFPTKHETEAPTENPPVIEAVATPTIVDDSAPESFDSLISTISLLKSTYPDILGVHTAGYSENGRELMMLTLGTGEKKALLVGAIHAREHITTKYLLKVTEDYCHAFYSQSGYYGAYNIKALLSEYTLYIIPCTNPDGLEIISGRQSVKNGVRVSKLSEYKSNANGVDLNRNFPLAWDYINNNVHSPADYYFKGYESGSEAETKALMTLCRNNNFDFLISFHIKGNCIFWGDNHNTQNNALYKAFATDIATPCSLYLPDPTKKAKDYGGGFENWFRHTFGKPGICIELADNENKILPLSDENYEDFESFVNYRLTSFAPAAAMASANK